MKSKSKRIFSIIFIAISFIFIVATVYVTTLATYNLKSDEFHYFVNDFTYMTVGEKVKFSEINPHFKDNEISRNGKDYTIIQQGVYDLLDVNRGASEETELYVDGDGYVNALAPGLYRLEYTTTSVFAQKEGAYKKKPFSKVYANTILVYEKEENYKPFSLTANSDANGKYVLTEDLTITQRQASIFLGNFRGILINPDGYTITYKTENYAPYRVPYLLFNENHGIIDGLKINVISSANVPFTNFDGLVTENYGVISNCEITGEVFVDGLNEESSITTVFPQDGYVFNNKASLAVYTNENLYPWQEKKELTFDDYTEKNKILTDCLVFKDNEIELDCHYFSDLVKCSQRTVDFNPQMQNGNQFTYKNIGKTDPRDTKTVELKIPLNGGGHDGFFIHAEKNSPLTVPLHTIEMILAKDSPEQNLEVKYWLVNGKKYDTLDGLSVQEDLTIEPCVKYTETWRVPHSLLIYRISNADEVLLLNDEESSPKHLSTYFFEDFFSDPRNVIPKEIVITKNCLREDGKTEMLTVESKKALYDYLLQGGKLTVEENHEDIAFINGNSLCFDQGKQLDVYFPFEETKITLHPQIYAVSQNAFILLESATEIDFAETVKIDSICLRPCTSLEKVSFGEKAKILFSVSDVLESTFIYLFEGLKNLKEISISPKHLRYYVEENFIVERIKGDNQLIYALPSLSGAITVPTGVNSLYSGVFKNLPITEVTFVKGDNEVFHYREEAFIGCDKLEKIDFGEFTQIQSQTTESTILSSLTTIVFSKNLTELTLGIDDFQKTNVEVVTLPQTLTTSDYLPKCQEFQLYSEGDNLKVFDGVLYRYNALDDSLTLVGFPNDRETDVYTTHEDCSIIGKYSFYMSKVKKVVCGKNVRTLDCNAFYFSYVEEVEFLQEELLQILQWAFYGARFLQDFTIPETTYIYVGWNAFNGCKRLTYFPSEQVTHVSAEAFKYSAVESFHFTDKITAIGSSIFENSKIKSVEYSIASETLKEVTNSCFKDSTIESVKFNGKYKILNNAFENCKNLKSINLENVTAIGSYAFSNSGLTSVESLTLTGEQIGICAFKNCSELEFANFPLVSKTQEELFAYCSNLKEVKLASDVSLADRTFLCCSNLEVLDSAVTYLGLEVFTGCSSLKILNFKISDTLSASDFQQMPQEISLYLNVDENFKWYGILPKNLTLYVPVELVEKFVSEWLANEDQIVGYDFDEE